MPILGFVFGRIGNCRLYMILLDFKHDQKREDTLFHYLKKTHQN